MKNIYELYLNSSKAKLSELWMSNLWVWKCFFGVRQMKCWMNKWIWTFVLQTFSNLFLQCIYIQCMSTMSQTVHWFAKTLKAWIFEYKFHLNLSQQLLKIQMNRAWKQNSTFFIRLSTLIWQLQFLTGCQKCAEGEKKNKT